MVEKIEKIGVIILIVLLILIAGVEGFCLIKYRSTYEECKNVQSKIVYRSHEYFTENIQNEMPDYITLKEKAFINGGERFILIISSSKDILRSTISIEYYDEDNNLIKTDTLDYGFLYRDNDFVVESEPPKLSNVFSGKVVIKIETVDPSGDSSPGKDKTKINLSGELKETLSTNQYAVSITGNNSLTENINYLSGYALLYKDGEMIDSTIFNSINPINSNTSFTLESTIIYSEEKIDYDNIKFVINYLY